MASKNLPWVTRGREQLCDALGTRTMYFIAKAIGINQAAIAKWRDGVCRPEPHFREALEHVLGIPQRDWYTEEETAIAKCAPSATAKASPRIKAIADGGEAIALKAEVARLNTEVSLLRVERDTALNAEKVLSLEGQARALELPRMITLQIPDEWLAGIEANLNASLTEMESELARLRGQLATAREDASEMEKKAIAEGSEALAMRAEVDRLKSSINAMLLNALDTPVPWDEVALRARIGSLELDTQWRQAYELQGPDREIVLYHSRLAGPTIVKWQGCGCSTLDGKWLSLGDLEDLRAVWMHIPALPESSN